MTGDYINSVFSLEGKVALVTGAAGFFGRNFTECLLRSGARVILYGRGKKLEDFSEIMKSKYGKIMIECCNVDLYDYKAYSECLKSSIENNSTIDILVNNAYEFSRETGFNDPSGKIESISREQWIRGLESGVYWYGLSTQIIAEKMKQQNSGSIINISSMYALVAPDPGLYEDTDLINPPSYGAAKAAILAFTRYAASFYGKYNIRVNAIAPGAFPNSNKDAYNAPKDDTFMEKLADRTILGRTGVPKDLEGALVFLASNASSYMTGQTLVIDGGWTVR